ncbi:MAG TPA: endonuclease/exonuclease/phosphatase family protein, partial [Acidimicrobiales bacterium]|nr:endonuclease/exonuclease/phosphatase family protein [Acidimicrobiales bacterium]
CEEDTDRCELPARVALLAEQLADGGCPELVSLQEANQRTIDELTPLLGEICDGAYEVVWDEDPTLDREAVLTTEEVLGFGRTPLAGPLRTAFWVRAATDVGVVDYVSSHLASSSDDRPCDDATCPPPCEPDDSVNTCQGRQLVEYALDVAAPDSVLVVGGDLNARPDEPTIAAITDAGFVDTHLAAGNPECEPETGEQCTSGRIDDAMTDLEDPESIQTERIDYLFIGGDRDCDPVEPTGLFNPGPAEGDLAHPSDHTGVLAELRCPTTDDQREAAPDATVTTTTSTTAPAGEGFDAATEDAITQAFTNLFDGSITDVEVKLGSLQGADELREHFLASYEATREVAAGIRVRIDEISRVDDATADVTYTLLLDGAAVLDHLPGQAVNEGGTWLVSLRTYCDVSTQGSDTIPPPCR